MFEVVGSKLHPVVCAVDENRATNIKDSALCCNPKNGAIAKVTK